MERVGFDVAGGGDGRIGEDLLGEHDALEAIDLHVVAELVGKRNVTRRILGTLDHVRRVAGGLRDVLGNAAEYVLEAGGARRRLVEVGVFRTRAELVVSGRGGVVAGNGVQEAILLGGSRGGGVSRGVRAILDANGVDGRAAVLQRLGSADGRVGDVRVEVTVSRTFRSILG